MSLLVANLIVLSGLLFITLGVGVGFAIGFNLMTYNICGIGVTLLLSPFVFGVRRSGRHAKNEKNL